MVQVRKYYLKPTPLIPNSSWPLLHYSEFFSEPERTPVNVYDTFLKNGWEIQWIYRYGENQKSHYHSGVHECMAVLTGTATIRFGVADTECEREEVTNADGTEAGGLEITAREGDVFVIPAGVAHKTYKALPETEPLRLTGGDGHSFAVADHREALKKIELSGFTMLGAYPIGGAGWDYAIGGDHLGEWEQIWAVPKPENDPVLGSSNDGVTGQWV